MAERTDQMGRNVLLVILIVVPFILVSLPGIPHRLGRTIAVSSLFFLLTAVILWVGLNPKSKIIFPGGKLSQPEFDSVRPRIEKGIRLVIVAFGCSSFCVSRCLWGVI